MTMMKMSNGIDIPSPGYGTWQTPDGDVAVAGVREAILCGYTHIDTAAIYGNEVSVGKGIKESGIDRKYLFVTSKLWNKERGYKTTLAAFDKTLKDLDMDYLDLYLIHWPAAAHQFDNWVEINLDTWKAMSELYQTGKIRSIGVSNFKPHHLEPLMKTEVKPMVNQIEFHPGFLQEETVKYCKDNDILVEAWSPLGNGRVLKDPVLAEIADKYNKSVAQICIRWCIQHDVLPLPKSVTPSRIRENYKVYDFVITDEDMERIDGMGEFGASGMDPDKIKF